MHSGGIQGPEQVMNEDELRELLGCDVVPLFKVLFAQMVASCKEMTEALHQSSRGRRVKYRTPNPLVTRKKICWKLQMR